MRFRVRLLQEAHRHAPRQRDRRDGRVESGRGRQRAGVFWTTRTGGDDTILVMVNLTGRTARVPAKVARLLGNGVSESQVLLSTYDAVHGVKSIARGELARWRVVIQL